jgi:hypothetical protein
MNLIGIIIAQLTNISNQQGETYEIHTTSFGRWDCSFSNPN